MATRIAFISEHASPLALLGGVDSGGQNVYVDQTARNLAILGYEVDIFTRWDQESLNQIIEYLPSVRIINIKAGPVRPLPKEEIFQFMDEFAREMVRFINQEKINYKLIHAHFWMSGYVAREIKRTLGIPYIITFHALGKVRKIHQGTADKFPSERIKVEWLVSRDANFIIAECPQDKEDLMVLYYAEDEKIKVIPCGFNKWEFYPMNRTRAKLRLGIDPKDLVILQLGRMVPRKGVDNVIRGLSSLIRKVNLPVKLLIVGGESEYPDPVITPEIGRLQQIAQEENIADKIVFIGRRGRNELRHFYNAADVFVSTPWYEPFGMTPLEAMACGTPVIGSNVGGIKYSVDHGKSGFLVPPNDPEALAYRLFQVLNDKTFFNQLSLKAIERVNKLFTWETVTKEMADIYEMAIRNRNNQNKAYTAFYSMMNVFRSRGPVKLNTIEQTDYEHSKR